MNRWQRFTRWVDWDSVILYGLLGIVAIAAAVISFDSLRGLAEFAGFSPRNSWLVPVVVDAGAAAGTRVWLTRIGRPMKFARFLALVLIACSIAGNSYAHWLAAYRLPPPWWLVPAVAAIAPVVLAAVVHLAVLVSRARRAQQEEIERARREAEAARVAELARITGGNAGEPGAEPGAEPANAGEPGAEDGARVAKLIAAGLGRKRLADALDISQPQARKLIEAARNGQQREETIDA